MFLLAQITHEEMLSHPNWKESKMIKEIEATRNGNEIQRMAAIKRMNLLRPNVADEKTVEWYR